MSPSNTGNAEIETSYDRVHLEDYWRIVRRRGWLVVLTTVAALAAAFWAASQRPQLYRSALTLQVGDPRGRMGHLGDQDVTSNMLWTDPVESELQQLSTQAVADWVVDSLQLRARSLDIPRRLLLERIRLDPQAPAAIHRIRVEDDGSVSIESEAEGSASAGQVGRPIGFAAGTLTVRPGVEAGTYRLRVIPRTAAESMVSGGLAASIRPETNLIDVTYTGSDPLLVPAILNTAAEALRDLGVRRVRDWALARTRFINERLEEAAADLQGALRAVEAYKQSNNLTSLDSEEARILQRMSTLQDQIEALLVERALYTDLVDKVRREGLNPGDVQQFALVSAEEVNRTIAYYYERLLELLEERSAQLGPLGKDPAHPAIVGLDRRIAETQEQLVQAAGNAVSAIDTRMDALSRSLAGLQGELRSLPAVETELSSLEGQVEIYNDTYKYLLARYQESQIAEAEIAPYVDVLDPASRAWPISGGRRMNVLLGGLLGLLLGVGAAFFLEYVDRSVHSTSDVERALGIPVLGWIPRIEETVADRGSQVVLVSEPEGSAAEAYRVLRTNLAFSTAREELLCSLVFTSPGPAEGKSTTAANLSAVLAARGDRSLLIDADLRRGELHDAFDVLRSPGLTELLVGQVDVREAIRPAVRQGLDFLPAGQHAPNPSELLGSQAMADLLATWREEYRWILLDAPPVLAVADAAVLAALSDGSVLVLKADETDRRAAWRAVQQLKRVDARVVGSVLNLIKPEGAADRYYLDYYYRQSS
ncbi:MAG: polysaccharide biosynthesis tyrosine autokinase [Gemmatimonadetes bacterium]|uniref:non-specific protein-tyrosine kinase n=1 Tax=Candidatus Kutchimonas denitrificans TaxID=3056748 RepID=A0AAE4Z853_9BACT|nr:polysaccharide biosynthesis tyrosine autokinase [Gemmatimonadota bacterium]NIR75579.1 polysaccharide biosynthesis tyrosine autokinase [Candidatus Kutchimonas denitrificans]NIS01893.1 polysaccharide biosynthesis tyrosine autokinase [Gemmatimonadota bacterium]NIT67674.1 polysaccharide biosynthesis tyrosine autokinase [Gemmatimonadota bacterium]NIU53548.1 polysaccharide biosynthesis tyrosine autokinase [Gemmatimonadota bacterium]